MSDTPIQRKPPPKLDCALGAHERRARLIAQLHEQAVATANDLVTQRKAITAVIIKDGLRRRKAEPWLCASIFLLTLGGIVAVGWLLCADPTVDPRFGKIGKQTIEDTGALTKKRMETIDDETSSAAIDYMKRQQAAGKPFFVWFNSTRMHLRTHVRADRASPRPRQRAFIRDGPLRFRLGRRAIPNEARYLVHRCPYPV
jgi:hypothetical protein